MPEGVQREESEMAKEQRPAEGAVRHDHEDGAFQGTAVTLRAEEAGSQGKKTPAQMREAASRDLFLSKWLNLVTSALPVTRKPRNRLSSKTRHPQATDSHKAGETGMRCASSPLLCCARRCFLQRLRRCAATAATAESDTSAPH